MRSFIALPIPSNYQEECQRLVQGLRKHSLPVKWVASGNFHVTLKFIGETKENMVPLIIEEIAMALTGIPPISLSLETLGVFPPRGRPRVIWVGVREWGSSLASLAGQLNRRLETIGIPRDAKRFSPHLTLGRVRPGGTFDEELPLQGHLFAAEVFQVSEVVLYKSDLQPRGPVYTPIKIFPLN